MKKLMIAAMTLFAFGATELAAQSQTATATVTVPTILAISVTNTAIGFNPTAADFDQTWTAGDNSSAIETRGNVTHDLTVQADNASFAYTGTATTPPTKPAGDLTWSLTETGTFTSMSSTTSQTVAAGLGLGLNAAADVWYRVNVDYTTDVPGTYTLDFTYTVTAN